MATHPPISRRRPSRPLWVRIPLAILQLALALGALWLGMSIPSYFRSVSPLVLEAAAEGTPNLIDLASDHLQSGRPGLALPLIATAAETPLRSATGGLETAVEAFLVENPFYRWSGGPAPFFEEFLKQAAYLREDETAVIPTLLPAEHRRQLLGFLNQSPNLNVQRILSSREFGGWNRFYPVYSTSGHPLEATLLTVALLEQSASLPDGIRQPLLAAIDQVADGSPEAMIELESFYLSILTIGRYANWLQLKTVMLSLETKQALLSTAQTIQKNPADLSMLIAAYSSADSTGEVIDYLRQHGDRGRDGLVTAMGLGTGALESLLTFNKPLYQPPAFWNSLPQFIRSSQQELKSFAESFPHAAIAGRVFAFGLCGVFIVGIIRTLILGRKPPPQHERRLLINLDSFVGAFLATLVIWILIEPGLLDFRPNEEGSLEIKLAQMQPTDTLATTETALETMIDQVTILVLLLFFVLQLLVFIFGLLKIVEIRRQTVAPQTKLHLLDNEENLFDLGLYVGLGGTVSSLILVVLNIVDASLMAAYASTLFGIIFVAILKVGFLRPSRRSLILDNQ